MLKVEKFKLKNGLRVLVVPMKDTPSVTTTVWTRTGSRNEGRGVAGISHFLEHIVFKGSKKRPTARAISEAVDNFGGEFNAGTGKEITQFYIKAPVAKLADAVDILGDMVVNPLISSKEVEKEKGVIKAEIDMYEDLPMRKVYEIYEELVYKGSSLEYEVIGTKKTVDSIKRDDFLRYRKEWYVPKNMLVTVAGGVTSKQVRNSLSKSALSSASFHSSASVQMPASYVLASRHGGTVAKASLLRANAVWHSNRLTSGTCVKVQYKKTDQTHMILGFLGKKFMHKDMYAEHVLRAILGGGMSSRMFSEVREKRGLAYSVRTSDDYYVDTGSFQTYAGVEPGKALDSLKVILKEYKKMTSIRDCKIKEEELKKAKEYFKGHFALGLEDTSDVGEFFGSDEIFLGKTRTVEEIFRRIDKVTVTDVVRVAKDLFKPERMVLAVVGPFKEQIEFEKIIM